MITADQLLCHAVGDYVLQSDWMANEKTKRSVAALAHVLAYSLPFLFLRPSLAAYAVIVGTHFVIDRWRLARFLVFAKNLILAPPPSEVPDWDDYAATGYHKDIIADNVLHVLLNGAALRWL